MSRNDLRRRARIAARQGNMTPGDGAAGPQIQRIDFGHNSDPTLYYSSDFITNDRAKSGRDLQPNPNPLQDSTLADFALSVDGYPTENIPKTINGTPRTLRTVLFVDQPSPFYPAGQYVIEWEGTATVTAFGDGTSSATVGNRFVRTINTPSATGLILEITTSSAANPIRNLRCWMPGCEGATTRFYAPWLELLEGTSVFRCMNLARTNDANNNGIPHRQVTVPGLITEDYVTQCSIDHGMSIEWQVALCNEANVDMYLTWPHAANDATWTYVLEYVRDNLAPHLRLYLEAPGNEPWNNLFPQHTAAWTAGFALGLNLVGRFQGADQSNPSVRFWTAIKYQAYRAAQIFAIAEDVFGGKPSEVSHRYRRILGAFVANATIADVLGDSITDVTVNPLYDGENANELFDHFAIAPYFGVGMIDLLEADPGLAIATVMDELEDNATDETAAWLAANKVFADLYGVTVIAYEFGLGAHSPVVAANARLVDVRASARCETAHDNAFAAWAAGGGGLICTLGLVFPGGTSGHWGLWNSQLDFTNGGSSPSWDGFQNEVARRLALL